MILYHVTPSRRVNAILKKGLIAPVYLSSKRYLNDWMLSALINFYNTGRGGSLSVLKVQVPNNWFYDGSNIFRNNGRNAPNIGPEYIVGEKISEDRIKLLSSVRIKETVDRGIKEGWLIQVMSSGKEVKPKWKSKVRKQFARVLK